MVCAPQQDKLVTLSTLSRRQAEPNQAEGTVDRGLGISGLVARVSCLYILLIALENSH